MKTSNVINMPVGDDEMAKQKDNAAMAKKGFDINKDLENPKVQLKIFNYVKSLKEQGMSYTTIAKKLNNEGYHRNGLVIYQPNISLFMVKRGFRLLTKTSRNKKTAVYNNPLPGIDFVPAALMILQAENVSDQNKIHNAIELLKRHIQNQFPDLDLIGNKPDSKKVSY